MNSKGIFLIAALSSLLAGCFGGSSGSAAAVVVTPSFLDSGTSLTYNSSNATTLAASREFQNFNYRGASTQNPLEVLMHIRLMAMALLVLDKL